MDNFILTQEQQELAEKNHNLIYHFAQQKGADVEDVYGVLAIGLCKAAKNYDASRGFKFSTPAFQCMNNEYAMYGRHENNIYHFPPGSVISYNSLATNTNGENVAPYLSIITNRTGDCIIDTGKLEVDEFIKSLTPIQQKVITCLMDGCRAVEIAERLGCSRQYVYKIRNSIRRRWLSEL